MTSRPPYQGTSRKLVLAFDVGTTYSGISYCILDPGLPPEIKGVFKFPDQELISSDSKVPSIIYYGQEGEVKAIGASAVVDGINERAEDGGWAKVEWFKLHLRPKDLGQDEVSKYLENLPPLPLGKTIVTVFSDYLKYMLECAKAYIQEKHTNGTSLWLSLLPTAEFVLSHPNGWEGPQQSQMRRAAVLAGLVSDLQAGTERVHFVTEGEACLHFCVGKGMTTESMKKGYSVMIIDAGGGTVDISTYKAAGEPNSKKIAYAEASIPKCFLNGSIFVSQRARKYLHDFLQDTRFFDEVDRIVELFDKTAKLRFRSDEDPSYIKFGLSRDHDTSKGVRSGQLKLPGKTVATFFQPSLDGIVETILEHRWDANLRTAFLVGGFAANDWLFNKIKEAVEDYEIDLCRPDNHVNKAVADGAVSYFIDRYVSTRKARYSYGIQYSRFYEPTQVDCASRESTKILFSDGNYYIPGGFSNHLPKGTEVSETKEFCESYYHYKSQRPPTIYPVETSILRYAGTRQTPSWVDEDRGMFQTACRITADLPTTDILPSVKPGGTVYYGIPFDIIVLFGQTELKAQIAWKENGVEKRGAATVMYDVD